MTIILIGNLNIDRMNYVTSWKHNILHKLSQLSRIGSGWHKRKIIFVLNVHYGKKHCIMLSQKYSL